MTSTITDEEIAQQVIKKKSKYKVKNVPTLHIPTQKEQKQLKEDLPNLKTGERLKWTDKNYPIEVIASDKKLKFEGFYHYMPTLVEPGYWGYLNFKVINYIEYVFCLKKYDSLYRGRRVWAYVYRYADLAKVDYVEELTKNPSNFDMYQLWQWVESELTKLTEAKVIKGHEYGGQF